MRYLKEIVKAGLNHRNLPSISELLEQYPRWKKYLVNKDVFQNAIPWITFSAIDYLDKHLNQKMKIFEYGGGGSTLFFASRVGELVTIEHNDEWFDGLKETMKKNTSIRWKGLLIGPDDGPAIRNLNKADPDSYSSEDENFAGKTFKQYASAIDQYPDEYFDVVLVDGRARPSCLKHSLGKVKKNGLLILDNSDRPYYLERMESRLGKFKLISNYYGPTPYATWFTQTHIWQKTS